MKIIIRKAERKDIPAINALTKEMHRYLGKIVGLKFKDKELKDEEIKPSELKGILAAEDKEKGKVVGYLIFSPKTEYDEWYGKHVYLNEIAVSKKYRGKGIGKNLMNSFLKICKKKRASIKVDTLIKNKRTIEFYKKFGFKPFMVDFIRRELF